MSPRAGPDLGVLCLEAVWEPGDLRDQSSVYPLMELLARRQLLRFLYRPVGSSDQLLSALELWSAKRCSDLQICYLAMHGDDEEVYPDSDGVGLSLKAVGDTLEDRAHGRILHYGSCRTLFDDDGRRYRLSQLRSRTGARALTGYEEAVDWEESAAFELLLFGTIAWKGADDVGAAFKYVLNRYGSLAADLGFVARTRQKLWRTRG